MGKYSDILANAETLKQEAEKVFKAYDTDASGYLDKKELRKPMEDFMTVFGLDLKSLPEGALDEGIEETFNELDTKKDGKLSPEEFLKFVEGYFGLLAMKEESK